MEEPVTISGAAVSLEGRFTPGTTPGAVVITHPHPLFGGSMDNNVVWSAVRAFKARGWAALRFNFRGVGRSTGAYGEGLAEAEDVAAGLAYLKTRAPGPHYVVGYSFGAAAAARALVKGLEVDGAILISPPIAFMGLSFLPEVPRLKLIIAGDLDEFCPLLDLQALLMPLGAKPGEGGAAPPEIVVIDGADHFFGGREERLFQILRDYPLS